MLILLIYFKHLTNYLTVFWDGKQGFINLQYNLLPMRILPLIISGIITTGLVVALNTKLFLPAPLGKLLSPQQGVWQNAESSKASFSEDFKKIQRISLNLKSNFVSFILSKEDQASKNTLRCRKNVTESICNAKTLDSNFEHYF
jgi:hypothetical protein